jgi:hypothetical protein
MRQVLIDLVKDLRNTGLVAEQAINGEGRVSSLVDEENVIEWLLKHPKWKNYVSVTNLRGAGDMVVKDYDESHPIHLINIKSTNLTTDNATSIVGFAYGLTDLSLNELPSRMNEKKLIELIKTRPNNLKSKDYYYLVFDKKNMSNLSLRPLKDVEYWKPNPSNRLQIDWGNEFHNQNVTNESDVSAKRIIVGLKSAWDKKVDNMPKDGDWDL